MQYVIREFQMAVSRHLVFHETEVVEGPTQPILEERIGTRRNESETLTGKGYFQGFLFPLDWFCTWLFSIPVERT